MRATMRSRTAPSSGRLTKVARASVTGDPALRLRSVADVPFDRRARQTRQGVALKAGALLVREWKGRLERVMILEEGFAWNGQTFSVVQSAGVLRMRIMRMGLSSSH